MGSLPICPKCKKNRNVVNYGDGYFDCEDCNFEFRVLKRQSPSKQIENKLKRMAGF